MQRYITALLLIIVYSCGEPWESVLFPAEDVLEVALIDTIAPTIGGIQAHQPYAINDVDISVWAQDDIDMDRVIFFINVEKDRFNLAMGINRKHIGLYGQAQQILLGNINWEQWQLINPTTTQKPKPQLGLRI